MSSNDPYYSDPPQLKKSFVCFADILGFSQLSKEAIDSGKGDEFLFKIRNALNSAYEGVRENSSSSLSSDRFFSIKIFTDNIVVGYPIDWPTISLGESELGHMFRTFSQFQLNLALAGYLVRGGIAFGDHYMDDDIVFGDALLAAAKEDNGGGAPKITFSASAVEVLRHHLGFYGRAEYSPQSSELLQEQDGSVFINYLENAFMAFPDGPIFFEIFENHRKTLLSGFEKYSAVPAVQAKYEWAIRYHNFVCDDFIKNHPVPTDPNTDPAYGSAILHAQRLSEYKIDIETTGQPPARLTLDPILP